MKRPNLLAPEDLPRTPRQHRSLTARRRLAAAGLDLFAQQGYERTSVQQIARRARVAVGGFYLHFRSKRQLLLVLMDDFLDRLSQLDLQPNRSAQPRRAIHDLLARAFATDLKYAGVYRAWREAVLSDRDLARQERDIRRWTRARVVAFLTHLREVPRARAGADIERLAPVLDSLLWSLIAEAAGDVRLDLKAAIEATTDLIYHALFEDPEKKGATKRAR